MKRPKLNILQMNVLGRWDENRQKQISAAERRYDIHISTKNGVFQKSTFLSSFQFLFSLTNVNIIEVHAFWLDIGSSLGLASLGLEPLLLHLVSHHYHLAIVAFFDMSLFIHLFESVSLAHDHLLVILALFQCSFQVTPSLHLLLHFGFHLLHSLLLLSLNGLLLKNLGLAASTRS
jgi:hypothetical protein